MSAGAHQLPILQSGTADLQPFRWPASRKRSIPTSQEWAGALFILVNATLFIRPSEIIPALEEWPIYAILVTGALLMALPQVLQQLSNASLVARPVTLCVLALFFAVILSHLSKGDIWNARLSAQLFLKILLYYLLLLAVVVRFAQLRRFLIVLVALGVIVTALAVLQYHGLINIPALATLEEKSIDAITGDRTMLLRLVGTGIFNDPNDLCLFLIIAMAASGYCVEDRRWGRWRALWLGPLGWFGYVLTLTQSRGGFIAFLTGLITFMCVRLGWRRALPICVLALVASFYLFAGRQTDLDLAGGTGQGRIQLWHEGLLLIRQAPIWGVGRGNFVNEVGAVAHNSFIHSFAELGFLGGTAFLGMFALMLDGVRQVRREGSGADCDEIIRFRPYLLGAVAGYAAGLMSLSRPYVVSTYLIVGIVAAYLEIARLRGALLGRRRALLYRMTALSIAFLVATYIFVRLFVRWD